MNVLIQPVSGSIYFDNNPAGSNSTTSGNVTLSYNTSGALTVSSNASTSTLRFAVSGGQGGLFSVYDSLTGQIFAVNKIGGIPIVEVYDTDTVKLGTYLSNTLLVSGTQVSIGGYPLPATIPNKLSVIGNTSITGSLNVGTNNTIVNTSNVLGGSYNIASGAYSFIAGGSGNDTKGLTNTFILGTNISATQANFTYVNNLSVQGNIASNTNYVVKAALTANQTMGNGVDTILTLDPIIDPNNWFSRTAGTGLTARRITPNVPGYYNINYQVSWQPGVSAGGAQNNIQVMKVTGGSVNTISIVQQPIINTSINTTQNTSVITYMNGVTDYLYFQAYSSNSAQVITGEAGNAWTKVDIFKIN